MVLNPDNIVYRLVFDYSPVTENYITGLSGGFR